MQATTTPKGRLLIEYDAADVQHYNRGDGFHHPIPDDEGAILFSPDGVPMFPARLTTGGWRFADWIRDRALSADGREEEFQSERALHMTLEARGPLDPPDRLR